jgi:hypothetical protein
MTWTDDDGDDVREAIEKMRAACDKLQADLDSRRARPGTRAVLDGAIHALLALDDVYFSDDDGRPVPESWRRARALVRKA